MKKEDLEKIIAKHNKYDAYEGGQYKMCVDDEHYISTIKKVYVKEIDNDSKILVVQLEEIGKLVSDPESRWIPEGELEHQIYVSTWDLEKEQEYIRIFGDNESCFLLLPKDHPGIEQYTISREDIGRRKDGSKQIDKDIMKSYLFEELTYKDNKLETVLGQITPITIYREKRNIIKNISDTYKAIFAEHYEKNGSILYLHLVTEKGIFTVSSHEMYYPRPEEYYTYSDFEYNHPEGELTATLKDNKINVYAKYKKSCKYHDGYDWREYTYKFEINKEVDLSKI